ncbi:hypothetical protein [Gordonia sp. 852002-10350_SCH5691597]|uniref:hypothetical protein n=1 Tax=Gordonia sp. 852002-10350_SCH5691597 TaxID=1834085 RepID=UPI0007EB55EB|nr:hypothetical protein [Gordonia sp. 852002-10350_SCH5691597]OBA61361.1 hypothetical protein A5777_03510 [Gordonia sp. 852002-10350_SCH5691597]
MSVTLAESITAATARALADHDPDPDVDLSVVVIRAAAGVVASAAATLVAASCPEQLADVLLHQPVAPRHLEGLLAELHVLRAPDSVIGHVRDAAARGTSAGYAYSAMQVLAGELTPGDTLIDLGDAVVGRVLAVSETPSGQLLLSVAVHDRSTAEHLTVLYDLTHPGDVRVIISAGVGEADDDAA